MHPIEDIRGSVSTRLKNKRIVLGITGSIAAVETIKMARELARHGAEVIPVMSEAATRIIHPDSIHFATGNSPIIKLDGAVQHVELCGETSGRADLLLIAPSTANTISKIAHGIDDTPVTTMATCAMGSEMPIIIVPAMHGSMYKHRILLDNIETLKKHGVEFVQPRVEENKAKIASRDDIVHTVLRVLGFHELEGKRVLVITGPTAEPVDDVRVLSNTSSGVTGIHMAMEAFYRGAEVELWASGNVKIPDILSSNVRGFESVWDLKSMAGDAQAEIILVPAAISDFTLSRKEGKLSSANPLEIELAQAPKILPILKSNTNAVLVGFKAETGIGEEELAVRARARMEQHGLDMIVANLLENVKTDETKARIIQKGGKTTDFEGRKTGLASLIFDLLTGG